MKYYIHPENLHPVIPINATLAILCTFRLFDVPGWLRFVLQLWLFLLWLAVLVYLFRAFAGKAKTVDLTGWLSIVHQTRDKPSED